METKTRNGTFEIYRMSAEFLKKRRLKVIPSVLSPSSFLGNVQPFWVSLSDPIQIPGSAQRENKDQSRENFNLFDSSSLFPSFPAFGLLRPSAIKKRKGIITSFVPSSSHTIKAKTGVSCAITSFFCVGRATIIVMVYGLFYTEWVSLWMGVVVLFKQSDNGTNDWLVAW